jgi:quinoprotein dehydrogenase-associated probable ABC transporter substrate-binding protein
MNGKTLHLICACALALLPASSRADTAPASPDNPVLKVCADPNNLPFSNQAGEGFENRLAQLLGQALGEKVEYTWWAQRRGFIRNTLKAGRCDVVIGVPSNFDQTLTTEPYYRSSYALVYRKNSGYDLHTLDDPQLAKLKIGVHLVGDGISPPAEVLARRGLVDNVVGYSIFGDYRQPNPPARLIEAVARGDVDVAIAWGPLAGYFARHSDLALVVVPLPQSGNAALPFQFSISMGVRRDDVAMRDRLNAVLEQKRPEIHALLEQYGVPDVRDFTR